MRVSQGEKDRSRARIVASATGLLREKGLDGAGAGVGDVMREAQMTHGGFYRHFASKDDLVVAAVDQAFDDMITLLEAQFSPSDPTQAAADFQAFYLSEDHVASARDGCPVAALSGDFARVSADMKSLFGAGVARMIETLAQGHEGSSSERTAAAARQFAMAAGAVMIARASDPDTGRSILDACRAR